MIPAKNKNVRYIAILLACKRTHILQEKKNSNNNKNGNKTWTDKYANNSSRCARASYFFCIPSWFPCVLRAIDAIDDRSVGSRPLPTAICFVSPSRASSSSSSDKTHKKKLLYIILGIYTHVGTYMYVFIPMTTKKKCVDKQGLY